MSKNQTSSHATEGKGAVTVARANAIPIPTPADPRPELRRHLSSWAVLWRAPEIAQQLKIEFSDQLGRALGRCDGPNWLIKLHNILLLKENHALLLHTFCHEAAHFAAQRKHSIFVTPHGKEQMRRKTDVNL